MTRMQFQSDVNALKGEYDRDNGWFGFTNGGNCSWSKGTWDEYVEAAWLLYKNAATNQLQRILLGDTKIRATRNLFSTLVSPPTAQFPRRPAIYKW